MVITSRNRENIILMILARLREFRFITLREETSIIRCGSKRFLWMSFFSREKKTIFVSSNPYHYPYTVICLTTNYAENRNPVRNDI
jgi:hypothetical protein